MGWYYCDESHAGKKCNICKKPVKKDDIVYFTQNGEERNLNGLIIRFGVEHSKCSWEKV